MGEEIVQGAPKFYFGLKSDIEKGLPLKPLNAEVAQIDTLKVRERLNANNQTVEPLGKVEPGEWCPTPSLSFDVKLKKKDYMKLRHQLFGKKVRLPRKLKKAVRHLRLQSVNFGPLPEQVPHQEEMEKVVTGTAVIRISNGYPRTQWVNRAIAMVIYRLFRDVQFKVVNKETKEE